MLYKGVSRTFFCLGVICLICLVIEGNFRLTLSIFIYAFTTGLFLTSAVLFIIREDLVNW